MRRCRPRPRSRRSASGRYRRALHLHAAGARHQIELEFNQFRRAVVIGLGADAGDAAAQAPLQRTQRLPLQPVDRVAGRMRLGDRRPRELPVPVVVMAIGAGEIELALALHEELAALRDKRRELRIVAGRDRDIARLLRDKSFQREQIVALVRQRRGLLVIGAAEIDALLEIDGTAELSCRRQDSARRRLSCSRPPRHGNQRKPCRPRRSSCSTTSRRRARTACRDWLTSSS